jgi:formate-dependent nitrite reductase membrane component NrfD
MENSELVETLVDVNELSRNVAFSSDAMDVFFQSLSVMAFGMIGIFCFMFVFYILVKVLDRVYQDDLEKE